MSYNWFNQYTSQKNQNYFEKFSIIQYSYVQGESVNQNNEKISILKIKKLTESSRLPTKGSEKAAGYDLYSDIDGIVPAHGKLLVKTGISVAIPTGNYGRIAPRSGLALKHMIDVGAGVVDEDYRGEVCVLLFNLSDQDFVVNKGDRVSQLIIEKITETQIQEVTELDSTVRNQQGFGSTDLKQQQKNEIKQ